MKAHWVVVALALAAGCSNKDDCEKFYDKTAPLMEKMAGKKLEAKDKTDFLEKCRKELKDGKKDPIVPCVLDAKDDAAVEACFKEAMGEVGKKSKQTEAQLQLNKIGKSAKVAFVSDAAFPKGKAAMLPAKPCCPDKCPPAAWASDPVWKALDFQIDEPNLFQYTYESDGQTFTATAVGDLDCDGTAITYTLTGKVTNGNPEVTLTEPPPNTD